MTDLRTNGSQEVGVNQMPESRSLAQAEPWLHTLQEGYYKVHRARKEHLQALSKDFFNTLLAASSHTEIPSLCLPLHGSLVQAVSNLTIAVFARISGSPSSGKRLLQVSDCLNRIEVHLAQLLDWQVMGQVVYERLAQGLPATRPFTAGAMPHFFKEEEGTHAN